MSENFEQPFPQPMMMKSAMDGAAAAPETVPIAGGENLYSVTVNIAFEITQ
jgi:uncharacterized protein